MGRNAVAQEGRRRHILGQMLQRSKSVREVAMFSLIALYFQYRKAQTATATAQPSTEQHGAPANEAAYIGIATAA
jgi:hypothetical protein